MAQSRRDFLKSAGVVGAAAVAGGSTAVGRGSARAQTPAGQAVRMVQTPVLDIGYEESGDNAGFPVILLHGFPYDVRSWDGVVPPLVDAGYRVLVPYLRGYGPTRFRDAAASRMAEQAAIAQMSSISPTRWGWRRWRLPGSTGAIGRRASRRSSIQTGCARRWPSVGIRCRTP